MPRHTNVGCLVITAVLAALSACTGDSDTGDAPIGDYTGDITIHRNIDVYGDLVLFASDNPGLTSDRTLFTTNTSPNNDLFWTLDARVVAEDLRDMTLSVDFTELGGCYFSGQTNPFQGTFTEGSCVLPTETGHVYFQLTEDALYQTANIFGIGTTELRGRWLEEKNGFLMTGSGTLYVRQHDQNSAIGQNNTSVPDPRVADYRDPFEHGETCVNAGIFGTGTLVEGDVDQCSGAALEMGGSGFDLYIDDGARLSFVPLTDNAPDQRIQGVISPDGAVLSAFTGNLAGPNTRYELNFVTGHAEFTNAFLWAPDGSATLCTVRWDGPLSNCQ